MSSCPAWLYLLWKSFQQLFSIESNVIRSLERWWYYRYKTKWWKSVPKLCPFIHHTYTHQHVGHNVYCPSCFKKCPKKVSWESVPKKCKTSYQHSSAGRPQCLLPSEGRPLRNLFRLQPQPRFCNQRRSCSRKKSRSFWKGENRNQCIWRLKCLKMYMKAEMLVPKCIYLKSIFAKCTRLACLLSFASLFLEKLSCLAFNCHFMNNANYINAQNLKKSGSGG